MRQQPCLTSRARSRPLTRSDDLVAYAKVRRRLPHVERGEFIGAEGQHATWTTRLATERGHQLLSDCSRKKRRDRIPDLPETVPDSAVEAEPVGIGVQTRSFSHSDTPRKTRVDRSGSTEGSS